MKEYPSNGVTPKGIPSEGIPNKGERPLKNSQDWQLNRDLEAVEKRIAAEVEKTKPDQELLNAWKNQRREIKDELRCRGRSAGPVKTKSTVN